MAEEAASITSAIANPEAADISPRLPPSPLEVEAATSLKRRQSDASDTESKRRRVSRDDEADPAAGSPARDERRKSRQLEERKRGQRLFGALLGTLSQGSPNAASKRRADIEKRQQAKLKQQDEEDSQRRRERLEQLRAVRRKEQKKRDERTMQIRHANMLHFANFLRTKAEPRLYYKPWELTAEQEHQIKAQIDEARTTIDSELVEFKRRQAQDDEEDRKPPEHDGGQGAREARSSTVDHEMTQEEAAEPVASEYIDDNANPATAQEEAGSAPSSTTAVNESMEEEMKDAADDEHGETMEEADEDTVIY